MKIYLPHYSLNKKELESVLSPKVNDSNIELFAICSKDQSKFTRRLEERGLEIVGDLSKELENYINKIHEEITILRKENSEFDSNLKSRQKLDFELAMIIHSNLNFGRFQSINFEFWRWCTLNYFIEYVRWRWLNYPDDINKIRDNSFAVFRRAFGERDRRIDLLRYWLIGERLFDRSKKYYYLEKLSERAKTVDGPFQDYINNIIDNNLFSPNDMVSKTMAEIMLIENKFPTQKLIGAFKRYHTYINRFFIEGEKETFKKEICI